MSLKATVTEHKPDLGIYVRDELGRDGFIMLSDLHRTKKYDSKELAKPSPHGVEP